MINGRQGHSATRLADGRVLVAGGIGSNTAEIFNPATGTWSSAGTMNYGHSYHIAALLNDGRVLVAGAGSEMWAEHANAEIYNPATNSWSTTGNMVYARSVAGAAVLADGRVLVAGGIPINESNGRTAEIYNPATGKWTLTGNINSLRYFPTATRLGAAGRADNGVDPRDSRRPDRGVDLAAAYRYFSGRRLPGGHEDCGDLDEGRPWVGHWPVGGGIDLGLGAAPSAESLWRRRRLAARSLSGRGVGGVGCAHCGALYSRRPLPFNRPQIQLALCGPDLAGT